MGGAPEPGRPERPAGAGFRRLTVAVTGGIGAGKSTVSRRLAEHGAVVIDSDVLAREVVAPGSKGLEAIGGAFGPAVVSADGSLDRAALAAIVFADPVARATLNSLTHPLVRARFDELRDQAPTGSVVVNDIPLLVDLATAAAFHLTIGVGAAPDLRVARLIDRGLAEADARARIAAQIDDAARQALCDVWLVNDSTEASLLDQVDALWTDRIDSFRQNLMAHAPAPVVAQTALVPTAAAALSRLEARVRRVLDPEKLTAVRLDHRPDGLDIQLTGDAEFDLRGLLDRFSAAGFEPVDTLAAGWNSLSPGSDPSLGFELPALGLNSRMPGASPSPALPQPSRTVAQRLRSADPGSSLNLYLTVT